MNTSRRAASTPFVTTLRIVGGVIAGATAVAAGAMAAASLLVARKVVSPAKRSPDTEIVGLDVKAQTITLTRTPDTALPGRYGLHVTGSVPYLKLGSVLSETADTVTRKLLTQVNASTKLDTGATFSGWYFLTPDELQLDYTPELIGSSVGPCPAWLFPGVDTNAADTWAIVVHGRGTTRAETLRAAPVFDELGMTTLIVSYRNDTEAPRSQAGAYGLGATEWQDVDAALGYAKRHGAKRVVLMGWSMGGAIVMQTLLQSQHANLVIGVVLDSPVVDWREVLAYQAQMNRVPSSLGVLAVAALQTPWGARAAGADGKISFDDLDMVARAAALNVPVLILHSDDDGFVPPAASLALAKARPDIVTLEVFTQARHTKLWNYDEIRWTNTIVNWTSERLDDTEIEEKVQPLGEESLSTAEDAD